MPSAPSGVDTVVSVTAPAVFTVPVPVSAVSSVAEIVVPPCRSKEPLASRLSTTKVGPGPVVVPVIDPAEVRSMSPEVVFKVV